MKSINVIIAIIILLLLLLLQQPQQQQRGQQQSRRRALWQHPDDEVYPRWGPLPVLFPPPLLLLPPCTPFGTQAGITGALFDRRFWDTMPKTMEGYNYRLQQDLFPRLISCVRIMV